MLTSSPITIKTNIEEYTQYKSHPLPSTQTLDPHVASYETREYILIFFLRLVSNPCASNPSPCVHGTCYDAYTNVDQAEIPPEGYTCHCYEGYFGINCQCR
jgi:hypothetical protein